MITDNNATLVINYELLEGQNSTANAAKCFKALSTEGLDWMTQVTLINAYGRLMRTAIEDGENSATQIFRITRDAVQSKLSVLNLELAPYVESLPEENQEDSFISLSLKINEAQTRVEEAAERFVWSSSSDRDPSRLTPISPSFELEQVITPAQLSTYSSSSNLDDMANRPPPT